MKPNPEAEPATEVRFRSTAFNTTTPREYFINDCCFGDDLCRWLIARLRAKGIATADEPDQEDFGWFFTFTVGGVEHCLVAGFCPENPETGDYWTCWVERQRGLIGSVLFGRKKGVLPEAVAAIADILGESADISDVAWQPATPDHRGRGQSPPTHTG